MRISKPAFECRWFGRVSVKWIFAAVTVLFAPWLHAALTNPGFETSPANSAPASPWVTQSYINTGIIHYPPQTFADLALSFGGAANTVVVGSGGAGPGSQSDSILGSSATLRWPLFGDQSAVVNKGLTSGANKNVNVLTQTMTIGAGDVDPSDGKIHVRFSVAPVIQHGGHPFGQEAYTFVEVNNVTQNTSLFHAFYDYDSDSFDAWQSSAVAGSTYHYTDWQAIDVSPGSPAINMGDMVKVTLVAAGCVPGSHEAHFYVDSSAPESGLFVSATGPAIANSPGPITYTYSYGNRGGTSNSVVIDVTPPAALLFASLTTPMGATCVSPAVGSSGTITCNFTDPVPAGAQGSFTTTFTVPANTFGQINLRNYDIHSTTQPPVLGPPVDTSLTNRYTTATTLVSDTSPATVGQSVTFTATVTGGQSPTGTVEFKDSATTICTSALSSGSATCPTATLPVGTHSITAIYSGDTNNVASTSNTVMQQVNQTSTITSLATSCMTTFVENQPFTMMAVVSGAAPTGGVSFVTQANVVVCPNVPLSSGNASCTTSTLSAAGPATEQVYSLTANYAGDVDNASSTSTAIMVTVLNAGDVVFRNGLELDLSSCPIE